MLISCLATERLSVLLGVTPCMGPSDAGSITRVVGSRMGFAFCDVDERESEENLFVRFKMYRHSSPEE